MGGQKRAEIYTYNAKDMIFSLAWSVRKDKKFRLAAGSFVEEYQNKVEILYLDETKGEFGLSEPALSFSHPFPATKVGESILSVVFTFSPSGRRLLTDRFRLADHVRAGEGRGGRRPARNEQRLP